MALVKLLSPNSLVLWAIVEILYSQLPALPSSSETISVCHLYNVMCYFLFHHDRVLTPPGRYIVSFIFEPSAPGTVSCEEKVIDNYLLVQITKCFLRL